MRRLVAIFLGAIVVLTSGQVSALHTHAYADHDHPEHQHGLAAHEHVRSAPHHDDDEAHLESCDPGQHAVSLTMGCVPLPPVQSMDAECAGPSVPESFVQTCSARSPREVRVHGPPARTRAAPRAPPLIFSA